MLKAAEQGEKRHCSKSGRINNNIFFCPPQMKLQTRMRVRLENLKSLIRDMDTEVKREKIT
jgi:hypothetical protein